MRSRETEAEEKCKLTELKELDTEEDPKRKVTVEEDTKKEIINREKEIIEKESNVEEEKNFDPERGFTSEDSESDRETASSTNASIKKTNQNPLPEFAKARKQRSQHDLIDEILKNRYSRMNRIFDEPTKAIPLPRRSGTIDVTFSERVFPTPARESSHAEEQEVRCVPSIVNCVAYLKKKRQDKS